MKVHSYLYILTLIIFAAKCHAAAASIVTDGLVSYWSFEQNTIIGRKVKDIWGDNDAKKK